MAKQKKYYYPKRKAELSLQFWWDEKTSRWNLLVTKNKKKHSFSWLGDPMIFGESLAKDKHLDENDKEFLQRVFEHYLLSLKELTKFKYDEDKNKQNG